MHKRKKNMIRKIIKIDEDKCNGCGICAKACHEGAIVMVNNKAKLLRDDYCDGLGDCLPVCPTGAITFEEREAAAYDEAAVMEHMEKKKSAPLGCGCPGSHSKSIQRNENTTEDTTQGVPTKTHLNQWPVQIKLVSPHARYFSEAHLLVAADCAAYAYGNFHSKFMKKKITIIGCPKLDDGNYAEKLTEILKINEIKSVTVVRMEVPCCAGIETAVKNALRDCGKIIPWQVVTISTDGKIVE